MQVSGDDWDMSTLVTGQSRPGQAITTGIARNMETRENPATISPATQLSHQLRCNLCGDGHVYLSNRYQVLETCWVKAFLPPILMYIYIHLSNR